MDFGYLLLDQIMQNAVTLPLCKENPMFDFFGVLKTWQGYVKFWSSLGGPHSGTYREFGRPSNRLSFRELPSGTAAFWHRALNPIRK